MLAIGFPLTLSNTLVGQNGFLTAALIGRDALSAADTEGTGGDLPRAADLQAAIGLLFRWLLIAASSGPCSSRPE